MSIQYTTHNRAFGLVYKGNPKSSNVVCCVPVSRRSKTRYRCAISFQSAVTTLKHLAVTVRFAFFRVNVMAAATSLTGVSRWNKNNWSASQDSFVSDEDRRQLPWVFYPLVGYRVRPQSEPHCSWKALHPAPPSSPIPLAVRGFQAGRLL